MSKDRKRNDGKPTQDGAQIEGIPENVQKILVLFDPKTGNFSMPVHPKGAVAVLGMLEFAKQFFMLKNFIEPQLQPETKKIELATHLPAGMFKQ